MISLASEDSGSPVSCSVAVLKTCGLNATQIDNTCLYTYTHFVFQKMGELKDSGMCGHANGACAFRSQMSALTATQQFRSAVTRTGKRHGPGVSVQL